jgi:hypothetical protein
MITSKEFDEMVYENIKKAESVGLVRYKESLFNAKLELETKDIAFYHYLENKLLELKRKLLEAENTIMILRQKV